MVTPQLEYKHTYFLQKKLTKKNNEPQKTQRSAKEIVDAKLSTLF